MKNKLFITFVLTICIFKLFGQCDKFTVYQSKGENYIIKKGIKQRLELKEEIDAISKIMIGENSYIVFCVNKDKILKLFDKGTLSFNDLKDKCSKNQNSLSKEYFQYVGKKIVQNEEPQTAMVIKGAVYRSESEFDTTVMKEPGNSSVQTDNSLNFKWHKNSGDNELKNLVIFENCKDIVINIPVTDTVIDLKGKYDFKKDVIYTWKICNRNQTNKVGKDGNSFIMANEKWKEDFLNDIAEMRVTYNNEIADLRNKQNKDMQDTKKKYYEEINK